MSRKSPLYDIALQYISEVRTPMTDEARESAGQALAAFIDGEISSQEAQETLTTLLNDCTPVDRIQAILDVPEEPLPAVPVGLSNFLRRKTQQWTQAEDLRLIAGLHKYGNENWAVVARFVGSSRTRSQCGQRWQRGLDPRISREHWTDDEEKMLLELVLKHGLKSWIKISKELGSRSDVQCRYRYLQIQRDGTPKFTPTCSISEVEPLPCEQLATPPPGPNLFDGIFWDTETVLSMKPDISFGCTGQNFLDSPWSL
jgi:hypothetical protein